jgi:hypothetical protein
MGAFLWRLTAMISFCRLTLYSCTIALSHSAHYRTIALRSLLHYRTPLTIALRSLLHYRTLLAIALSHSAHYCTIALSHSAHYCTIALSHYRTPLTIALLGTCNITLPTHLYNIFHCALSHFPLIFITFSIAHYRTSHSALPHFKLRTIAHYRTSHSVLSRSLHLHYAFLILYYCTPCIVIPPRFFTIT